MTKIVVRPEVSVVKVTKEPMVLKVSRAGVMGPAGPPGPSASVPSSPQKSHGIAGSIALGATTNLTTGEVSAGTSGQLAAVTVSGSIPLKVEIISITSGVPTTHDVIFTSEASPTIMWQPPHKSWIEVPEGSTFRVALTNMDTSEVADAYATIYWDEV